jgi:ABC-2 type transport system ATP-binding protein
MWRVIGELVAGGTTLLLTTQYLEEADSLADCIAVIDHGRVIALGSSDELKAQVGGERLEVTVGAFEQLPSTREALAKVGIGQPAVDEGVRQVSVAVRGGTARLVEALRLLDGEGVTVIDVGIRRPTLDDVFLALTGHGASDSAASDDGSGAVPAGRGRP